MAIQECGKGHLYDTEQYQSCPYCVSGTTLINFGMPAPGAAQPPAPPQTPGTTLRMTPPQAAGIPRTMAPPPAPGMVPPQAAGFPRTMTPPAAPGMTPPAAPGAAPNMTPPAAPGIPRTMAPPPPGMAQPMTPPPAPGMAQPSTTIPFSAIGRTTAPGAMIPPSQPDPIGRTAAPVSVTAPDTGIGKTVAPMGLRRPSDDGIGKTVGVFQRRGGCEPVVGWLVCTEGGEKGRDFRLLAKINTIGRSERMDVCIKNDPAISRENHARIGYDQKHGEFHLIPGDGGTVYLKDAPVYVPTKLEPYDIIEMGGLKLMFVPFVGEHFTWDSSEEKQG